MNNSSELDNLISKVVLNKQSELSNNQTKLVKVDDTEVLLSKFDDKFYAVGSKCTHFGGPLADGVLCDKNHVRCPWHKAKFDLRTGEADIEDCLPALDNIACFKTSINEEDGSVTVHVPKISKNSKNEKIERYHRTPQMSKMNLKNDSKVFLIIGGGASGAVAVETLRKEGFEGRIVCVSEDEYIPYDRTELSKGFLMGNKEEDQLSLRTKKFYEQRDIEFILGKKVKEFNCNTMQITFEDNFKFPYEKIDGVILATGATPRRLKQLDGYDSENVYVLRSREDSKLLLGKIKNEFKHVVIIGGSFIGTEVASAMKEHKVESTIVAMEDIPFENILGEKFGKFVQRKLKSNGVNLLFGNKPKELKVKDGKVTAVITESGKTINCDAVIMAVGVSPNTQFLKGLNLNEKDKSVNVDKYLCADEEHQIYACGDIAKSPDARGYIKDGMRIEHWKLAQQHGEIAAHNLLTSYSSNPFLKKRVFDKVPYFWTKQSGFKIEYFGHAQGFDEVVYKGDDISDENIDSPSSAAFFIKDNKIHAVACVNAMNETSSIYEMQQQGILTLKEQIESLDFEMLGSSSVLK